MDEELQKQGHDPTVCVFSGFAMAQSIDQLKSMESYYHDSVSSAVTQASLNLGKMEACGLDVDTDTKMIAQEMVDITQGIVKEDSKWTKDLTDEQKLLKLKQQANKLEGKIWNLLEKARG